MANLTLLLEAVDKPSQPLGHLRTCAAVGVLEAHAVSPAGPQPPLQPVLAWAARSRWRCTPTPRGGGAATAAAGRFRNLRHPMLGVNAVDYRQCDFHRTNGLRAPGPKKVGPERDGQRSGVDGRVCLLPMGGMVSVAERIGGRRRCCFVSSTCGASGRQQASALAGEGVPQSGVNGLLFEWAYPQVRRLLRREGRAYPALSSGKGRSAKSCPAEHCGLALLTLLKWVSRPTLRMESSHHRDGAPSDRPGRSGPAQPEGQSQTQRSSKQQEPTPSRTTSKQPTAGCASSRSDPRSSGVGGTKPTKQGWRQRAEQT